MRLFILKLILICGVVFAGQLLLPRKLQTSFPQKDTLDSYINNKTKIIYFIDSVNYSHEEPESNSLSITEMLQKMMPGHSLGVIEHQAYGLDIYLEFCEYMAGEKYYPKIIIVPINLRSFSPVWDLKPGFQFQKEKIILTHDGFLFNKFGRPLFAFKSFNLEPVSDREYKNSPVYNGDRIVARIKDYYNEKYNVYTDENMKEQLVLSYMAALSGDHRKVRSMEQIAQLPTKNNMKIIFYVTPIDYQTGNKFLGPGFEARIKENISVLSKILSKYKVAFLDLSTALDHEYFRWKQSLYPNEHLNAEGREFIARTILDEIRKYPGESRGVE